MMNASRTTTEWTPISSKIGLFGHSFEVPSAAHDAGAKFGHGSAEDAAHLNDARQCVRLPAPEDG